jgi:hypothetical protein
MDAIVTCRDVSTPAFWAGMAEAENGKATTAIHKMNPVRKNILPRRLISVIRLNVGIMDVNYYKYRLSRKIKHLYL